MGVRVECCVVGFLGGCGKGVGSFIVVLGVRWWFGLVLWVILVGEMRGWGSRGLGFVGSCGD